MNKSDNIAQSLKELIREATKNRGYVYIVDKKRNNFVLRLTEEVNIKTIDGFRAEEGNT